MITVITIIIANHHLHPHFHPHHRHHGSGGHPVQNLHWCSYQQSRLEDLPLRKVYQAQREQAVKVARQLLSPSLTSALYLLSGCLIWPLCSIRSVTSGKSSWFSSKLFLSMVVRMSWKAASCPYFIKYDNHKKGHLPLQCVLESCRFCNRKSDICCLCLHLCL